MATLPPQFPKALALGYCFSQAKEGQVCYGLPLFIPVCRITQLCSADCHCWLK